MRELGILALGAALGLAAAALLPLAPADPLRGTLVLLPLILAALVAVGRAARRHGGRRTPPGVAIVEAIVLGLLVLAALGRGSLGLRYGEALVGGLVAAGLFLLLAHRVARLLLALRPWLGRRLAGSPPAAFFWLPFVVYLALLPWQTGHRPPDGDEPYNLLVAHSLAYDLDTDLANNYAAGDSLRFMSRAIEPQPGDPTGPGGEMYSRHNMLLPLVLAPAYRLGGKLAALAVMAALTAALAWTTLGLARHLMPERPAAALAAFALLAFTPPLLLYSYQVWVEVPAALLVAAALDRLLRLRESPRDRASWAVLGLCLLLLPLLKLRFVVLAASLLAAGILLSPGRVRRRLLAGGGLLALAAGAILVFNQLLFDNPLKHRNWDILFVAVSPETYLRGSVGVLWDCAFGLFAAAPLWLLVWPAALRLARRRHLLGSLFLVVFGPYLVFVVASSSWYGGWSPPMRYALVILPLLALAVGSLAEERRRAGARALVAGLGAVTLALALLWTVLPGWTYNFADGRSHLVDALGQIAGGDAARLFPSTLRPRAATWIWPPVTVALALALWSWPRRRSRSAAAWGLTIVLLAPAATGLAARRLPTRVIEFEDPWVEKIGGELYPERWALARHIYRCAWRIGGAGDRVRVPLVAGGSALTLGVELRVVAGGDGIALVIDAGDHELARRELAASGDWEAVAFEALPWPRGERLTLRLEPGGTALLDRAFVEWQ